MTEGMLRFQFTHLLLLAILLFPLSVPAVIFYATADPEHNTSAPSGPLANSGWHLQGRWGNFLGTPVASNYFITALHVGGSTDEPFFLGDRSFRVLTSHRHSRADLALWQIEGTFTNFAQLYQGSNEVGHPLVVFGRGRIRGDQVIADGKPRGWEWGGLDARLRWGENQVAAITADDGNPISSTNDLQFIRAIFRTNAGPNEAHLANGDSSGALFIQEDGIWKLAGMNHSVDGRYSTNSVGREFDAALFDERGLYKGSGTNWVFQRGPEIQPSGFYATRISAYRDWIERIIEFGNPFGLVVVESTPNLDQTFAAVESAEVNSDARTARISSAPAKAFIRLRASGPLQITSITNDSSVIVISFREP